MKLLSTLALVVMISVAGAAQENAPQDDSQQPTTTVTTVPQSGSPRGEVPPEVPGERGGLKNSLQVGVNVYGSYDGLGNIQGTSEASMGEGMVFRLNSESQNRRTSFAYVPSYSYATGINLHTFSQAFDADTYFVLGKRWSLRMQNAYRQTMDPFTSSTSLAIPESPNYTVATPYVNQKSEVAVAELDWLASKHVSVGFVGNFAMRRYDEVAGLTSAQPFFDSTNSSGRAFVRYAFNKRFTVGVEGQYQDLFVGNSFSRTQSYSAVAYTSMKLTKHSTLTLYGGPQRSYLHNTLLLDLGFFVIPLKIVKWETDPTGGASYSLVMKHAMFYANYSNRITDGGGLMGPVILQNIAAGYERDFSPRWTGSLSFGYGDNSALSTKNTLRTYSGTLTVKRKVTRDMNLSVSYQNLDQSQTPQQFAGFLTGNRSRVFARLEYVWNHPLGK